QRTPHMLDTRRASKGTVYRHHVDPHPHRGFRVLAYPPLREPPQPAPLVPGHGFEPGPEAQSGPRLDLAHHDRASIARDEVDLADVAPPVPVQHEHALLL